MSGQLKLAKHFDHIARRYDSFFTKWAGESELRQIRPFVPAGSTVLDYGRGTGRTTIDLLKRGCTVTAYDFSRAMLNAAREKVNKLGLAAEFVDNSQVFAGRVWPLITCIGVVDYYADPVPLLKLLSGYLSSHGRIAMTFPNAEGLFGLFYTLGSRISMPVYPQTSTTVRHAAEEAGMVLESFAVAFPSWKWLSLTGVYVLRSPD